MAINLSTAGIHLYYAVDVVTYKKTTDVAIVPNKIYFTRSGAEGSYVYTKVTNPVVGNIGNYYEIDTHTRPTAQSSWTDLVGIKSTPDFNPAPDTLETTTLNETEWKTYIDGLKDPGGALEFNFNMTQELVTLWGNLMNAYEGARDIGTQTWFLIDIPGLTQGFYFTGNPSRMGLPPAEVSSVLEITNRITPTGAPVRAAKPTA